MTLRAFHISPAIMKIITANIPRIIVGIVRWILKIVKLLLFLSSPFVTEAPHLCAVSEVSLDWDSDGQWRYYFNSWRQLSANWRPLHLSSVSTSAQMSSEMLGAGAGSRHSQLWHVWWGWPVTTQAVSRLMGCTNTALMTTLRSLRSEPARAACQMWRYMCYPGPHGGGIRSPDIVRPG